MEYISITIGFLLILAGLWALLTRKNIIRIIIGFSLFDTGLHVVMVSVAYIRNATAPIIDEAVGINDAAKMIVDPLPQALVLTAIVIGLGVTALLLAYALKMYRQNGSLNISDFSSLKG